MKLNISYVLIVLTCFNSYCQSKLTRIVWNEVDNLPVKYATISSEENYTISNANGIFEFEKTLKKLQFKILRTKN